MQSSGTKCAALVGIALGWSASAMAQNEPQPTQQQTQPAPTTTDQTPPPPPPQITVHTIVAAKSDTKAPLVDFVSLRLMRDKNLISQAEFDSARQEIGANVGDERAEEGLNIVVSKWSAQLYGFLEGDFIGDSTQSFNDSAGNALVARPIGSPQPAGGNVSQYAGSNPRLQFSVRNSRFGLRVRAPEFANVRASGVLEMDFLGFDQPSTEAAFFDNPTLRIRHAYLKLETPLVDVLIGQYWHIFGWQPAYFPNSVQIQGLPGELYDRVPQFRLSHRFVLGGTSLELGGAVLRPPTRDGFYPDLAGGLRFSFDKWRGVQTTGATSTQTAPASIAVTGDYRNFNLPVFEQLPTQNVQLATGAIAVDAFIPIVPATTKNKSNALSISGEFVYGGGIADLFTGLTGGITMPTIVNASGSNSSGGYPGTVDPGMVIFDNGPASVASGCFAGLGVTGATSCHDLHAIIWMTAAGGLQYYLPGGHVWIAGNYAHTQSPNIQDFTQSSAPNPNQSNYTQQANVRKSEDFVDGNVFYEPFSSVRFGVEYALFLDHYVDNVSATNHRVQFSGFFIF